MDLHWPIALPVPSTTADLFPERKLGIISQSTLKVERGLLGIWEMSFFPRKANRGKEDLLRLENTVRCCCLRRVKALVYLALMNVVACLNARVVTITSERVLSQPPNHLRKSLITKIRERCVASYSNATRRGLQCDQQRLSGANVCRSTVSTAHHACLFISTVRRGQGAARYTS